MSKVVAIAFAVPQALAALALLALSVHGPNGLTIAAPLYLVLAVGATWWAARRFTSVGGVLVAGVLALAAAPGVFLFLGELDAAAHERRVTRTHITELKDEPILAGNGRPIGVRVSYTVSAPERGYFAILPSLHSREPGTDGLRLEPVRWAIDGRLEPTPFEPGKAHAVVVELYPPIYALARGEPCLATVSKPTLPDATRASPLRLTISETIYDGVHVGTQEQVTREAYDVVELYRQVLAAPLKPCG